MAAPVAGASAARAADAGAKARRGESVIAAECFHGICWMPRCTRMVAEGESACGRHEGHQEPGLSSSSGCSSVAVALSAWGCGSSAAKSLPTARSTELGERCADRCGLRRSAEAARIAAGEELERSGNRARNVRERAAARDGGSIEVKVLADGAAQAGAHLRLLRRGERDPNTGKIVWHAGPRCWRDRI